MVARLKLVHTAPSKAVASPRPFKIYYYQASNHVGADWHKISHAGSKVGSIRAAIAKVVMGQYYKAIVHGEDGVTLYTITRNGSAIKVVGVFLEYLDGSIR